MINFNSLKNWFIGERNEPKTKSTIKEIENRNSTISFEIDGELNVTIHTRINSDITLTLIDNNYLGTKEAEDEAAIQLAFILIANEATEQLIEETNKNAEEFSNRFI